MTIVLLVKQILAINIVYKNEPILHLRTMVTRCVVSEQTIFFYLQLWFAIIFASVKIVVNYSWKEDKETGPR